MSAENLENKTPEEASTDEQKEVDDKVISPEKVEEAKLKASKNILILVTITWLKRK
ncbi:unnamed protein product [Staurois parvus]|uniref:Uncharacterized protein n=1 Tax=Staurois parvus TaxID=386267 RepID=A0ABN9DRX6_9NEOB|nr:unnamed protein product [Staurois parvus]